MVGCSPYWAFVDFTASRWKLHLQPNHLASPFNPNDDLPPLPPEKSAVDILTDFIKYLFKCAKTYIQNKHVAFAWSTHENSIEYIFTHPNSWEGMQEHPYCQAIERAGLVHSPPAGQSRVRMLTEGEANLHLCVTNYVMTTTANEADPQGVVIIDAGSETIDLSMFSMKSNPISCEVIAPTECMWQSSTSGFLFILSYVSRPTTGLGFCHSKGEGAVGKLVIGFFDTLSIPNPRFSLNRKACRLGAFQRRETI